MRTVFKYININTLYILIILLFQLLVLAGNVNGQACISGRIINADNNSMVEGANIVVGKNSGTLSDKEGKFSICGLSKGQIRLKVTCLGYAVFKQDITLTSDGINGMVIKLLPASFLMDELVVTATKTENPIKDVPVRVNMINPLLLQSSSIKSVDEVLQYAPGITVSRPFGIFSNKSTVSMRGMNGKEQGRILVLMDGVPVNKSDGGSVDWNMIDPALIEKVEITKGAGSALFGGNAMGGIINIITARPPEKLSGTVTLEYGSFNTSGGKINLGSSLKLKNAGRSVFWMANAFYRQSDGYITQSEADRKANPYIVKSNMKELGAQLKTGIILNKNHSLEARFNFYDDDRGTGEKVFLSEGNTTEHDSWALNASYTGKFSGTVLHSVFSYQEENYKKVNEYLKDDYTWYDALSVRSDLNWINYANMPLGKNHLLTGGFDIKNGGVDAYDKYYTSTDIVYNKGQMLTIAAYLQDEMKFWGGKGKLVYGVRYDHADFYEGAFYIEKPTKETSFMSSYQVPDMPVAAWSAVSPRVSVHYKFKENNRLYLSWSRGFRPSVLDDLCRSGRIKGGFKIATPNLKPEYLNNYEAGADWKITRNVKTSFSVYYSMGTDFQYYVSNGQTIDMGFGDRPVFIRSNISKVEILGAEAEIKYDVSGKISFFANYGYNHSEIIDYQKISGTDTLDLQGKILTDVPDHVFTLGGIWNSKVVNASVMVHYNGRMFINDQNTVDEILLSDRYPAYTTVDLKCWKKINTHFRLSLNVQNVFDTKYFDSKDAVCPGRFITGEVNYLF